MNSISNLATAAAAATAKANRKRNLVGRVRVQAQPLSSSSSSPPPPSIPNKGKNCVHDHGYAKMLVQNHSNFKRSGVPARLMGYDGGSWEDFAGEVVDSVRSGFEEGKAVVEVGIHGATYLFDLYRMLQVDLKSGNQRSIAWIDVHGKCFFPMIFVDGGGKFTNLVQNPKNEALNVNLNEAVNVDEDEVVAADQSPRAEIGLRIAKDSNATNLNEVGNVNEDLVAENPRVEIGFGIAGDSNSSKRKEIEPEGRNEGTGSSSNDQPEKRARVTPVDVESPRWPETKLLMEGERAYSIVKELFLIGVGVVEGGATINSIHQWMRNGPLDKARYEVFLKQLEMTKAERGDAKMTFAWYGSSAEGVATILSHGFSMPSKPSRISDAQVRGVGVYLSPVKSPFMSAKLSELDDNGEKHVILCRVILGKCEKVEAGSQQMYPSSVDFDTAVDDLMNPKLYVVWCANMNSHILPECVVSYRPSGLAPGQLRGLSYVKSVPDSSPPMFEKLLSKLGSSLPPSIVQECRTLFTAYKDGKVAKDAFMTELRSLVGDDLLASVIREVRG